MKANELMIGDWYFDQDLNKPRQWHQLQFFEAYGNPTYMVVCQPIRLTDEMLKMNGFRNITYDYYEHMDTWLCVKTWNDTYFDITSIDDAYALLKCRYVHELQHALRLCGLTDLADNFKV